MNPFYFLLWLYSQFYHPAPIAPVYYAPPMYPAAPAAVPTYMTVYGPIPINPGNTTPQQYVHFPPCIVRPGLTICP